MKQEYVGQKNKRKSIGFHSSFQIPNLNSDWEMSKKQNKSSVNILRAKHSSSS
jgi:hypothetical protein